MSKAKWFAVRKHNTGEIIATSANQIVPSKFRGLQKCSTIFTRPLSYCSVEGGSGDETRDRVVLNHVLSLLKALKLLLLCCICC